MYTISHETTPCFCYVMFCGGYIISFDLILATYWPIIFIIASLTLRQSYDCPSNMMTSSNGNVLRVTGNLCGEFTGPRWPVDSPHKWPITRKMFPLDDVIMMWFGQSIYYLFWVPSWIHSGMFGYAYCYESHKTVLIIKYDVHLRCI